MWYLQPAVPCAHMTEASAFLTVSLSLASVGRSSSLLRLPCRYSGKVGVGLLFPIVNDNIVWTLGSPLKMVSDAGVKFVPRNVPQEKLNELQQHFQDDADNEWSTGKSKKDVSLGVRPALALSLGLTSKHCIVM